MGVHIPLGLRAHPCFLFCLSFTTIMIGASLFAFSLGDVRLAGLAVGIMSGSLPGVFRLVTRWCVWGASRRAVGDVGLLVVVTSGVTTLLSGPFTL